MKKRLKVSRKWWRRQQKPPPCKNKKNMKGKDEVGLKRVLAQERTPSLVTLSNVDIITNFI
jgi:hypothetical protein